MFSLSLGHLGHLFFVDPNDPKAQIWRPGNFWVLGHLGHLDTVLKLVREAACVRDSKFPRVNLTGYIYSI